MAQPPKDAVGIADQVGHAAVRAGARGLADQAGRVVRRRPHASNAARRPRRRSLARTPFRRPFRRCRAFGVLHPVSVALEKQEWMSYDKCCDRWLPTTTPGLCRACALDERTCVQLRNAAPVGEPPAHPTSARRATTARQEERAAAPKSLDYKCYA